MTDIIARANALAGNGHVPGPWKWITGERVSYRNELIGNGDPVLACGALRHPDPTDAALIVFAPEAVQALAEEKFVYSVQVFMSGRWIFMGTLNTGNSLEGAAKWFPTKERAEYFASLWEPDTPARVVKRRVSPVVVDG